MKVAILGRGVAGGALVAALSDAGYELDVFATAASDGEAVSAGRGEYSVKDIAAFQPGQYTWVINAMPAGVVVEAPANGVLLDLSGQAGTRWWNDETPAPGEVVRLLPPAQMVALRVLQALGTERILSADLTALSPVSRLGKSGVERLAKETAKMLNGQGKDEGDIAFDLSVQGGTADGIAELSGLMPYQLSWGDIVVPTFHGMALRVTALGNQNWGDDAAERLASVGFSVVDDLSLNTIQQASETKQVTGIVTQGPRVSLTVGFDAIAQLNQSVLELLDRPL
ncbi:hypothetical protein [Litorivicinus lipolyticus]|uniref:hypothetical protein n=1 Tax=Litorivicinus lipolyticus TaxID=418701 RepID=UPI003B5B16DC